MQTQEFETFSQWLRFYRKSQRYSMRGLGSAVGVSGSYMSTLESNDDLPGEMSPRPSKTLVEKLARVLEADADEAQRLAGHKEAIVLRSSEGPQSEPPALQLVREQLAEFNVENTLPPEEVKKLGDEVAAYARWRVDRVIQGGGKQSQRHERQAA